MNSLPKIAILGSQGQLGTSLRTILGDNCIGLTRQDLDISQFDNIPHFISTLETQIIINCAAYNLVDKAEEDFQDAWNLNWRAPFELAKACQTFNIKLIQISTDYVFSQNKEQKTPCLETDLPGPETVYGLSKLAGEHAVSGYCSNHLIIRTCGLFGKAERGGKMNFIDLMLKKAAEGQPLKIVNDQLCSPTSTDDLAHGIINLIHHNAQGLFHIVNKSSTTWFDFAKLIFSKRQLNPEMIPVTTASFGAKAKRPAYSVLATDKYTQVTGQSMPTLEAAVDAYFKNHVTN